MDNSILHKSAHFCKCTCSLKRWVFVQGAHLCDLYEVLTCACTFAHCACAAPLDCILSGQLHMHMFIATQLEMKWSGICALLSTGHRSNVAWHWTQCGTLWYTLWYTLAHFLTLHTLALDTGTLNPVTDPVWCGSRPLRHNTPTIRVSRDRHIGTRILETQKSYRSCAKLFKSVASCSCT